MIRYFCSTFRTIHLFILLSIYNVLKNIWLQRKYLLFASENKVYKFTLFMCTILTDSLFLVMNDQDGSLRICAGVMEQVKILLLTLLDSCARMQAVIDTSQKNGAQYYAGIEQKNGKIYRLCHPQNDTDFR